jgi:hypothetical protein
MSKPKPKRPNHQVNVRISAGFGDRLRYACGILPAKMTQTAVVERGVELYIAEAEKMKESLDG